MPKALQFAMRTSIAYSAALIIDRVLTTDRRVLLFGESGIGKSTLAAHLAAAFKQAGRPCASIGADPGSPAFGVPGAVCLGAWQEDGWRLVDLEPLCTLDGGRFRLPLAAAVRRLSRKIDHGMVLVDAPGVVRGVAGAELLVGLVDAAAIDTVLVLAGGGRKPPLVNELQTLGCEVVSVEPSVNARRPGPRRRARERTRLWDEYLRHAGARDIALAETGVTGTPPPLTAEADWRGRQIALLKKGRLLAMGEVLDLTPDTLKVRIAAHRGTPDQILVRDAARNRQGWLGTARPAAALTVRYMPPPDVTPYPDIGKSSGPRPVARVGEATASLVNGIFGDPLLHLRLHGRKRSILFDLGEGGRLPARLAHQVTDVFISHAHIDHISGFLWLMRSRIGDLPSCRLFGPPGLTGHIAGLLRGIHWDRIGEWGPRFQVGELRDGRLIVHGLQAGREERERIDDRPVPDGLLLDDPAFKVWAVELRHGAIPVLAYGFEQTPRLNVRMDRLVTRDLAPGPWLGELKHRISAGDLAAAIRLPDGSSASAGNLADQLLRITPAQKLVYATDLADSEANREKLITLAQRAHTLFCEAAFLEAEKVQAGRSGHLTARGCGEIAQAAGVERLVPFHFSRRYEKNPFPLYDEARAACARVVFPRATDIGPVDA